MPFVQAFVNLTGNDPFCEYPFLLPGMAIVECPDLHEIRERMIEPSTWDQPVYKTIRRRETKLSFLDSGFDISPNEYIETDLWERILCADNGTVFWAWRHKESGKILI